MTRSSSTPRGAAPAGSVAKRKPRQAARRRGAARKPAPPIGRVLALLEREYPEARCSLDHENPLQLLVATILSAQCTDARVNEVTKTLFRRYRSASDYASADLATLEDEIRSTGFFRNKTKAIVGMAQALIDRHGGKVPTSMNELTQLPGVGRKTANVVLGNAFGIDEGIVVDTHVARIGRLLGLTRETDPAKIEQDLVKVVPRRRWTLFPHLMIHHGRAVCIARRPRCAECVLNRLCPSASLG